LHGLPVPCTAHRPGQGPVDHVYLVNPAAPGLGLTVREPDAERFRVG